MSRFRTFSWAAYMVAFLLILIPLGEVVLNIWPWQVGEASWRFGAAGLISRAVLMPVLGMLLAVATALLSGHRRTARVLSLVSLFGATVGLLAMSLFGLDALEARGAVRAEAMRAFDSATISALVKYFLGTVAAIMIGIGGWQGSRVLGREGIVPRGRPAKAGSGERVLVSTQDES